MSQQERPQPIMPQGGISRSCDMVQTQWLSGLPSASYPNKPNQRTRGPQLPPILSIPSNRSSYDDERSRVHLPPMQIPPSAAGSPPRALTVRSIPVAHLLSPDPPSPLETQPRLFGYQHTHQASPNPTYGKFPADYRSQPAPYTSVPVPRFDQVLLPWRQQGAPGMYQPNSYAPPHTSPQRAHLQPSEFGDRQIYSPAMSTKSSLSYTSSEMFSPRSSVGPSSSATFGYKPRVSQIPPFEYALSIRQQPVAARACGFGERDRRVIDPPPILELKITDRATGAPELDNAMLALHCTLLSPDGRDDETELPPAHPDMPSTRRLMGTLVASPYQAKDEHGTAGTFFVFPDLSCRSPGQYRLRFKLLRVDPMNMTPGAVHGSVAHIVTDVFSVYTAKDFPGMRASSTLLKALRRQGLNVGVKKGSEARKVKGGGKSKKGAYSGSSSEGEDDSEGDDGGGGRDTSSGGTSPKTKERKKGKRRRRHE